MKNVYRVFAINGVVFECEKWADAVQFQKTEGGAIYAGTRRTYKYKNAVKAVYGNEWHLVQDTCARATA